MFYYFLFFRSFNSFSFIFVLALYSHRKRGKNYVVVLLFIFNSGQQTRVTLLAVGLFSDLPGPNKEKQVRSNINNKQKELFFSYS